MNSKWISVSAPDGGAFDAWLALPPTGSGPGLLLLQEAMGVNPHIRAVADQYAQDGFVVLAPDIYWRMEPHFETGYTQEEIGKAVGYLRKLDFPQTVRDLASAVAALRKRPECGNKVGSIGYCMGGTLSYLCAAGAGVDAAVCYYGGAIAGNLDRAASISVPMLMHFGDQDGSIPLTAVDTIRTTFSPRQDVAIEVYPGAGHGFNCWNRADYKQGAAALARGRSLVFLARHLAGAD